MPRKSVVRLTDRPDMTLDVYRGRKTTMQQQQQQPTSSTCPNDFSDPTDQNIHTQCVMGWKIVVAEWWSVTAVSLDKTGMCTQNTTKTKRFRTAEPLGERRYENWITITTM